MGLAPVVVKKYAGGPVQLRHDDTFGAVDYECTIVGHQRDLAHVDFLLFHVFDGLSTDGLILLIDHQPQQHAQRSRIYHAALLTFLDVKRGVPSL